jgi:molybdate transport system regulatory protein
MKKPVRTRAVVDGRFWVNKGSLPFLGKGRVELLEMIDKYGSIMQAAKAIKMSYKAAWDMVDAMNNLSEAPLVERTTGGKGGGGTRVTAKGLKLIELYRAVNLAHQQFLRNLTASIEDLDNFYPLLRRLSMKTSARNHFYGKVSMIKPGAVNTEVELTLSGNDSIVALITSESAETLGLSVGSEAYALVKAPWVIITSGGQNAKVSARNKLCGTISRLVKGDVNSDVTLQLAGGNSVSSIITNQSMEEMGLKVGAEACAIFKASSVILGVD